MSKQAEAIIECILTHASFMKQLEYADPQGTAQEEAYQQFIAAMDKLQKAFAPESEG